MKSGSKFLKLVLVGVLGAAVMIGCGSDEGGSPEDSTEYDVNGCRSVFNDEESYYEDICDGVCVDVTDEVTEEVSTQCSAPSSIPEEDSTTTSEDPTTTVEETTTTTTVPQTTTTVKANKPISTTTRPPSTPAPTLAATTTVPPTTQAPTTVPTTQAPTTAPPVTLPLVNVTAEWSGSNTGCPSLYPGSITLDVVVTGGTSPRVTVSVQGSSVSQPGPSYVNGAEESFWFDGFPSSLPDGSYTVNISVSDSGHATTNLSKTVVYACV
jgi:hypothetical protein